MKSPCLLLFVCLTLLLTVDPGQTADQLTNKEKPRAATGPLRVHPTNGRYFTDGSSKAIYLTRAHTWNNLQDVGTTEPPAPFDFDAYLAFLENYHHNFIRLWRSEEFRWKDDAATGLFKYCEIQPWKRTGPRNALDGKPTFDLNQFDQAYFDRLRERVAAAGDRGIYVSIMLFQGWGLRFHPFDGHLFHVDNNVNGINRDPNGDGKGTEIHTLKIPAVTRIQEAYVRKVIDTVNDLDNVLYEIANESALLPTQGGSPDWQYHMINYVRDYESKKPRQHPVGMTSQGYGGGSDWDLLVESPADWISPNPDAFDFKNNPPAATGAKVILPDTDHLWGVGGDRVWAWKSFLRGHNPIWMDPYNKDAIERNKVAGYRDNVLRNLGYTRRYAEKMNLAAMTPQNDLTSTKYCLANPGREHLVYQPATGGLSVNLAAGTYVVEWFNPETGEKQNDTKVSGGGQRSFQPPFDNASVLYLKVINDR